MVPTMFHRLLALPDAVKRRYDVSSLQAVIHGAAPIGVESKKALIDWWGPVIFEYYGATEGGGTIANSADWLKKPGTVGKPWPGTEIRIFDDAGQPVPAGQPGNVYMKSMIGEFEYYKDPAKTQESRHGELFTVGDIGYLDEEGWLFLCDRAKDLIIAGGVNIYPAEIEKVLMEHPKVADAAVFGIPNEEWGEEVKAVIQPADGVEPGPALAEELLHFATERLARFKLPRSIDFIAELPRLDTGKLYKRYLRDP
jgi:long-chain acyl-CoA synthetase